MPTPLWPYQRRYIPAMQDIVPDDDGRYRPVPARPSKHGASNSADRSRPISRNGAVTAGCSCMTRSPRAIQNVTASAVHSRWPAFGGRVAGHSELGAAAMCTGQTCTCAVPGVYPACTSPRGDGPRTVAATNSVFSSQYCLEIRDRPGPAMSTPDPVQQRSGLPESEQLSISGDQES